VSLRPIRLTNVASRIRNRSFLTQS
jgi:hypothetical protein